MPLAGLAAGAGIARMIGSVANYLAGAAVIVLGIYMLAARDDGDEQKAGRLASTHGLAILALGISISLDEFAIGFSLGLVGLPVAPVIIAIALQALLASQLGLALGHRISERFRERAEQLAAAALSPRWLPHYRAASSTVSPAPDSSAQARRSACHSACSAR
jgi:putative Mn2+ efflux pump MntP